MNILEANKPLANGIKIMILKKGFRQGYVATTAGYTPQEFSDMLNGRKLIKACDIPKIAKVLKCSSDDIYAAGKGE